MADVLYGVRALREQYVREAEIGMIGNLGARIVEVDAGKLVIEADGTDAQEAVNKLAELFESKFGEE